MAPERARFFPNVCVLPTMGSFNMCIYTIVIQTEGEHLKGGGLERLPLVKCVTAMVEGMEKGFGNVWLDSL